MNPYRPTVLPPTFVVTLMEQGWKRIEVTQHFTSLGIDPMPVFVDGVYGPTINLRPTVPYSYNERGEDLFMHSVAIGLVISHRIALSVALASSAQEFIICEDDVIFPRDFAQRFNRFRASLPSECNVAQLEWKGEGLSVSPVNDYCAEIHPFPFCSSCIWWKRHAAQIAVQRLYPINQPYDIMLIERVFPYLSHKVAFPQLAKNRASGGQWNEEEISNSK